MRGWTTKIAPKDSPWCKKNGLRGSSNGESSRVEEEVVVFDAIDEGSSSDTITGSTESQELKWERKLKLERVLEWRKWRKLCILLNWMNLYMNLWLNTENRASKISLIIRVQLQHVCLLVNSRVNTSQLNTSLNYIISLSYCTQQNYNAKLSFISDFIHVFLSSFDLFLFLLCDLNRNFDIH